MSLVYQMRLTGGAAIPTPNPHVSGQNAEIYLPFDVTGRTTITLDSVHVSNTGAGHTTVEQIQIQFFPTQSGSIDSSEKHSNLVLPVFGQTVTRLDNLDLRFFQHLSSSQSINPIVRCFEFNGNETLTPDVYIHLTFLVKDETLMPMGERGAAARALANNKFVSGGSVLESINDKVDTRQITNQMRTRFM